jgi:Lrp/AsnC family transcriptional regulator
VNEISHAAKLDALDRKILRVLQARGDISQAELAQAVAASPASCWRRVKAMEAAGVLRETVRLVDPIAVARGLNVFCQVRMKSHEPEVRKRFEAFIQANDLVMECHSMSGEWDYLVRLVVSSVQEYEQLLMGELLGQDAVAASASHFSLKRVKYTTALPI